MLPPLEGVLGPDLRDSDDVDVSSRVCCVAACRSSSKVQAPGRGRRRSSSAVSPSAWNRLLFRTRSRAKSHVLVVPFDFPDGISPETTGQMNRGQSFSHRIRKVSREVEEVGATRES